MMSTRLGKPLKKTGIIVVISLLTSITRTKGERNMIGYKP